MPKTSARARPKAMRSNRGRRRNMILNSIRWRLHIWYGLILVAVLTGFGVTAYHLERTTRFRRIDEELQRRLDVLARGLRPPRPRPGAEFGPPPDQFPPPHRGPEEDLGRGGGPPPPRLMLPPHQTALFDGGETNAFYYLVWMRTGHEAIRSPNAPPHSPIPSRSESESPMPVRRQGMFREAFHFTPPGECLLVGRSIAADLSDLRRLAWWFSGVGITVLALGLAGGGWLAGRAIRPVEVISSTAARIASGDLSQRIKIDDTETELGRLASVLNSTFTRLESSFAEQARFTADAAHELRAPLSQILNQTQTALAQERTTVEFRKTVEACQRAARRMRHMVESLLEPARPDSGQTPIQRQAFDLSKAVLDCVNQVRPLAEQRGVAIHCELREIEFFGDADRIAQGVTNLLLNAVQYNKVRGEVRVVSQIRDGAVLLAVSDTGQGISAEDLPHVFNRFRRAEESTPTPSKRTGLGLAIARAIVAAHGGEIDISSRLGAGTTVTMRLPMESGVKSLQG